MELNTAIQSFVGQVLTANVADNLKAWSQGITRSEGKLKQLADMVYANGGRVEHFQKADGETEQDKALRSEMVRQWKASFVAGFSPAERKAMAYDKKEVPDEMKDLRKYAGSKASTYLGRFVKEMIGLQYPAPVAGEGSEGEGEGETTKPKKTDKDRIIEAATNIRKWAQRIEEADFNVASVVVDAEHLLATIMGKKEFDAMMKAEADSAK